MSNTLLHATMYHSRIWSELLHCFQQPTDTQHSPQQQQARVPVLCQPGAAAQHIPHTQVLQQVKGIIPYVFGRVSCATATSLNCVASPLQAHALAAVIRQALHASSSSSRHHDGASRRPDHVSRPPIIALLLPRSLEYVVCSLAALAAG
jgi:hypothetical protein